VPRDRACASSSAWLKPRSRRRARVRGTGTRAGTRPAARRHAAGSMRSPMKFVSPVQPLYLKPRTSSAAGPTWRQADAALRSAGGHAWHSAHSPGDGPGITRVSPQRGHRGSGMVTTREAHNPHRGGPPAGTAALHMAQPHGIRASRRSSKDPPRPDGRTCTTQPATLSGSPGQGLGSPLATSPGSHHRCPVPIRARSRG